MRKPFCLRASSVLIVCSMLGACGPGGEPQTPDGLDDTAGDNDKDVDKSTGSDASVADASVRQDAAHASDAASSDASSSGASSDLPCDVDSFLASYCRSCHGVRPIGGAPMSLVTYADLSAIAADAGGKTNAQRSLDALQQGTMPPGGKVASADLQTFAAWVQAGAQQGSCGSDAGTGDAGTAPDPYDTPTVCTSKKTWTGGNRESPLMHPGMACISCHARGEGPDFSLAGTIFPSAHEPDDCNGASSSDISIVVTDARGQEHTFRPNAAGNFYTSTSISKPYTAKIVYQGRTRAMATPQSDGDCNGCHTTSGDNGAPGRIMLP